MDSLTLNPNLLAKPPYSPAKSIKEYQEEYGLDSILDLASAINPLGPSQKAIRAIEDAGRQVNTYPGVECNQLRSNLAKHIDSYLSAENIILGNGSCDILRMAAEVFLYGGGEVILRRNAFPMYEIVTRTYGGNCVFVEADRDYSLDIMTVVEKITKQTKLIYLANPHNPTGRIITRPELDKLVQRIPPSAVLVLDHAYQEFVDDEIFPDVAKYILDDCNLIMTRTFSKMHGLPGLRIGYGVARKKIIDILRSTKIPFYNNTVSVLAASEALDDLDHVQTSRAVIQEGKNYLYQQLDQLGLSFLPTQSSYILLVDIKMDTQLISEALLRRGILVLPAHPYNLPQSIRVRIGLPEDNRRLIRSLTRVLTELEATNAETSI